MDEWMHALGKVVHKSMAGIRLDGEGIGAHPSLSCLDENGVRRSSVVAWAVANQVA